MKRLTYFIPNKAVIITGSLIIGIVLMSFMVDYKASNYNKFIVKDSVASVKAFQEVYKVLMSPRCMNCHPSGDIPLQGDDSHAHAMLPKRGVDGKGVYAMKCSNCHQPANTEGAGKPPGAANWHLPPANMKMVFQGKSAHDLAKQIANPKTNGNKNLKQLIAHADDGLVKWGWEPGVSRTKPPLTHEAFKKAWISWLENGAYAPENKPPSH